jgi:4-amino-4-deoxy-L-arabinose transferase-like glycosyltransferase
VHLPTVVFLAPAAVCVLSWAGAGLLVPRRLLAGERLLDGLTRVGFGAVAAGLVVLGLGSAGLLERWLLVALTVAGALAALPRAVRALWAAAREHVPLSRLTRVLLATVVAALAVDLVAATGPVTSADALKYHLALPKLWLQEGRIGDPFWRCEGFNPSGIEMLYTQGLALAGGSAAAALHAFLAVFCALAVFGLGRELGRSTLAGAVAAFLFTIQGIVTWEATSAFIELGLTFFVVLAVWHAVRFGLARGRDAAVWAGFFAGAAAGTKYLGLIAAAVVLGILAVVALRRRQGSVLPAAAGAALLAGGWWYLRNLVATGNPVYPFFFGGKWMSSYASHLIHAELGAYGVGGGVVRLAILPLDLVVNGASFDEGRYVGTAIFVFALLALFTRRTPAMLLLLGGSVVYVVAWHVQSPQARFLLPALAVLAAVGGAGAAPWLAVRGPRRAGVEVVLAIATVAWLAATVALTRQLIPVTAGFESRSAALQRLTGTYDALREARADAGGGTVGLVGYRFAFNVPGRAVSIDVPEFTPLLSRRTFLDRLDSLGVRALLVGSDAQPAWLAPIRPCLVKRATYHARFVTSRSLGKSEPYDLVLYSLVGCAG